MTVGKSGLLVTPGIVRDLCVDNRSSKLRILNSRICLENGHMYIISSTTILMLAEYLALINSAIYMPYGFFCNLICFIVLFCDALF